MEFKKIRTRNISVCSLFVAVFVLSFLFPYTGDDWAWGTQIGLDRLNTWFDDYNGRYFGNLIVLVITRSKLIRALVMSGCLGGIAVILNKLADKLSCSLLVVALCLVYMPTELLRQSVVWTSGFSNYATSIFLTLIYVYYIRNIDCKHTKNNILHAVFFLVLGFANTLIVEHATIYNVVLSVFVVIYTFVKYKKICIQHILYFLGCISGTVVMFSNDCYSAVVDGNDAYRTMEIGLTDIISKASTNYILKMVPGLFSNNIVLLLIISFICTVLWNQMKSKCKGKLRTVAKASITVIVAYTFFCLIIAVGSIESMTVLLHLAEALFTGVYALALASFVLAIPIEKRAKNRLIFILASVACSVAPLLIVSPLGRRCFFFSYVMLILFVLELCNSFSNDNMKKLDNYKGVLAIAVVVGFVFLFYIYGTITVNNNAVIEKVRADISAGKTSIEVELPVYDDYLWYPDLEDEAWAERFLLFYDIEENAKIKIVPSSGDTKLFSGILERLGIETME